MNTAETLSERIEVASDGCWLWTGHLNPKGYATVRWMGERHRAHRLIYELATDQNLADDMVIDHLCGVRHCVNPRHLEPVTNQENVWRGLALANNHLCKSGRHVLSEVGVITESSGAQRCRACRADSKARYNQRAA